MANIDAAFEQQIFNLPQRQRKRTYIITMRRMTSGEQLKYRNGLRIAGGYGSPLPSSSQLL